MENHAGDPAFVIATHGLSAAWECSTPFCLPCCGPKGLTPVLLRETTLCSNLTIARPIARQKGAITVAT